MNRTLKIAAVVVAALVLALVVAMLISGSAGKKETVTGFASPYTYTAKTQGKNLTVTIRGEVPQGCAWSAVSNNEDIVAVKAKSTGSRAKFRLTGGTQGVAQVTFALENQEPTPLRDRRYEYVGLFGTGSEKNVTQNDVYGREVKGMFSGSCDDFTYCAGLTEDGEACLILTSGTDAWNFSTAGTAVNYYQTYTTETDSENLSRTVITLHFQYASLGSTVLTANCGSDGVVVSMSTDALRNVAIHQAALNSELSFGSAQGQQRTAFSGAKTIESLMTGWEAQHSVTMWTSRMDFETQFNTDTYTFIKNDAMWYFQMSDVAYKADFFGTEDEPTDTVEYAGVTADVYEGPASCRAVWQSDGFTFLVETAEGDGETLRQILDNLLPNTLSLHSLGSAESINDREIGGGTSSQSVETPEEPTEEPVVVIPEETVETTEETPLAPVDE